MVTKVMWFAPLEKAEDTPARWRRAAKSWQAPAGIRRWLRSLGRTRKDPLLADTGEQDVPYILEEFWCEDGGADSVQTALLDETNGLARVLAGVIVPDEARVFQTDESVRIHGAREAGQGITRITIWRRNAGVSHEESLRHWSENHADMTIRHGGISHYAQCVLITPGTGYEGIAVIHFHSIDQEQSFGKSPEYLEEQLADAALFIDPVKTQRFVFSESFYALNE